MHIYTLREIAHIVERLLNEGMGLGSAVRSTAAAYGFREDDIYVYMTKHNIAGQGNEPHTRYPKGDVL